MSQNYRIYINEKVIFITQTLRADNHAARKIDAREFDFTKVYHQVLKSADQFFYVETPDPKAFVKSISKSVLLIEAAGGLVKNKKDEYLFIYRNNKWDLPKGKLERGEKAKIGAVREVEEECGIIVYKLGKKIGKTYHAYTIKNQVVLKKTHWYKMKFKGGGKLKPQIEEGITEVKWFDAAEYATILANTFPSIAEVMTESGLIKDTLTQPSE